MEWVLIASMMALAIVAALWARETQESIQVLRRSVSATNTAVLEIRKELAKKVNKRTTKKQEVPRG